MQTIGITGPIGAGKSLVLDYCAKLGAAVLSADAIYHDLLRPGQSCHAAVLAAFGEGILAGDGMIDRKKLGAIVFADEQARHTLDGITHPLIAAEVLARLDAIKKQENPPAAAVVEVPLMAQSGLAEYCDVIWFVDAPAAVRARRLEANRGLSPEQAEARIAAQGSLPESRKLADAIVQNGGKWEYTAEKIQLLYQALLMRAQA